MFVTHSTDELIIRHVDLDWTVNFEKSTISGSATLYFKTLKDDVEEIVRMFTFNCVDISNGTIFQFLDASELSIASMAIKGSAGEIPLNWDVGGHVDNIGSKLTVYLPTKTSGEFVVVIEYETDPKASALQWLTAAQTCGKQHPYLFSQCQAIHARSIVPCQDTPAVKFTYNATVSFNVVGLVPGYSKF